MCGVALCSRCGITAVDTHIADAELNLYPLTLYHLSCIMIGVSCMSPVVCARCVALLRSSSPSVDGILSYSLEVLKAESLQAF